jgi:hypothetical protein
MNDDNFILKLHDRRLFLWLSLALVIVIAGVRLSDGTTMLAISHGATIADPVFKEPESQIVLDSPLKVFLLQALPAKIIVIAVAFSVLAFLPAAGLVARDSRILWLTFATVFLTPAFKVSVQNIGYGDGLIVLSIMLLFFSNKHWLLFFAFFLIGLWHPQQSFFISLSFLLARYCYTEMFDRREALVVFASLACAAVVYFMYKSSLNYHYGGREVYMLGHIRAFLHRNPIYQLIGFAPIVLWFWLVAPKPVRGGLLLAGWLLILGAVSLLTSDVTRVMTVTSLPIVLAGATRIMESPLTVPRGKIAVTAIMIALIPAFSWSGLDFFLWSDLVRLLCKWESYCL